MNDMANVRNECLWRAQLLTLAYNNEADERCYVRFVTQLKLLKINNAKTKLKESRVRIHSIVKDYYQ